MADRMRSGELESRAGTPASTIRYKVRLGVLSLRQRVNGQHRQGEQALDDLEAVRIAQAPGFSLDEIEALLREFREHEYPPQQCLGPARHKLAELEELAEDARKMQGILEDGVNCNCGALSSCILTQTQNPA